MIDEVLLDVREMLPKDQMETKELECRLSLNKEQLYWNLGKMDRRNRHRYNVVVTDLARLCGTDDINKYCWISLVTTPEERHMYKIDKCPCCGEYGHSKDKLDFPAELRNKVKKSGLIQERENTTCKKRKKPKPSQKRRRAKKKKIELITQSEKVRFSLLEATGPVSSTR